MNRITTKDGLGSPLSELGIVLPAPPTPLGAYVEASDTGNFLFLSGKLPVVKGSSRLLAGWMKIFRLKEVRKPRASLHSTRWRLQRNISVTWTG